MCIGILQPEEADKENCRNYFSWTLTEESRGAAVCLQCFTSIAKENNKTLEELVIMVNKVLSRNNGKQLKVAPFEKS